MLQSCDTTYQAGVTQCVALAPLGCCAASESAPSLGERATRRQCPFALHEEETEIVNHWKELTYQGLKDRSESAPPSRPPGCDSAEDIKASRERYESHMRHTPLWRDYVEEGRLSHSQPARRAPAEPAADLTDSYSPGKSSAGLSSGIAQNRLQRSHARWAGVSKTYVTHRRDPSPLC